jgi:DNA-directed RNA polymerase subunit RPC12/RpoP
MSSQPPIFTEATPSNGAGGSGGSMSKVIEYKCLRCGILAEVDTIRMEGKSTGLSCHGCGFRIFVKPRRQSHKTLDAI